MSSFSICDSSSLASCSSSSRASTIASPASASRRTRGCTTISSAVSWTASNWRNSTNGFSRAWDLSVQHLVEHVLDEVVLRFEERDDFVGRFDNEVCHRRYLQ